MEATGMSIGRSVLGGAISYASSMLAEEVALQLGVRRDQVFITNELEMMQAFLMAAHDEGSDCHDRVVKVWVKQVRDVAYDVEDTLQEFAVRLRKQSGWRILRTLHNRRHVANQMKELRANVEDVSQRNMRYNLIKGSGANLATIDGQFVVSDGTTMSGTIEARRLHDKAKVDLVRLINNKDNDLRVIVVSGTSTGHLGKTSIIKGAYEDPTIQKKFECRAWIGKLTFPFSLTELLRSIIEQFHVNFLQESGGKEKTALEIQVLRKMGMLKEDSLVHEFMRYVYEKSYLIVLNEVHTIEEWGHIKPCFQINGNGSQIIVSTEKVGVASSCVGPEEAGPEYKQLIAYENLYAFYKKDSQGGTDSMEAGSSSNVRTDVSDSSANRKMVNRTGTMTAAFKESQLIGRENEKLEIINLITTGDIPLEVICVWGMGGLGKTALVRDVYQDEKLSGKCEKRACVTIMRPFSVNELLQNLASQFGYMNVPEMETKLPGKKYLIVLDDLLSSAEWDSIIPHFPAMRTSSRIIITTTGRNIATYCSRNHEKIYGLQSLKSNKALDLFVEKVFGDPSNMDDAYPELVEQAYLILQKCNGLPLAIVTIGGFLANQPKTIMEWRKLNEHMSAELEMNPELGTIRTVLMRGYDGLPYHLKSCVLYMPIFPEDYRVRRKRLVRRWAAEGYTREVRGKSADEIADNYFMELISRSIFLPSQETIHSTNRIDSCQVHDLIREIGISKSTEENLVFRLGEGCNLNRQGTVRHVAISSNWKRDQCEYESILDMSRVRSITVFGEWMSFSISGKISLLRVLDLEDTTGLHDHHIKHIGKLLHLRYLSLRGCGNIYHLPESLGNLRELQTLDVRGTPIIKLPKSIVNLRRLNNLCGGMKRHYEDISHEWEGLIGRGWLLSLFFMMSCLAWCAPQLIHEDNFCRRDVCHFYCCLIIPSIAMRLEKHDVLVPRGIRKLKSLHTLGIVNIARRGKDILKDIQGLNRLHKLNVTGVNKENGQELCSAIVGLTHLESLSIRSEGKPGLSGCLDGPFSFPESLQSLKLYGNLVNLPEWIQGLKNLTKLKLRTCRISEHGAAIQVLGNLPNLASLHLLEKSLFEGVEVHLNFCPQTFQSLVVLELTPFSSLQSVKFEGRATPKLEVLKFSLEHFNSSSLSGLPSLSSLKEVVLLRSRGLRRHSPSEMEYVRSELSLNSNRPVLKLD